MTDALLEWLGLIGLPLAAGLFALVSHVPLGEQVLRRGIVFIDLAIAQVAALGALIAHSRGFETTAATWAAAIAALLAASLIAWLARRWPDQREAMIGLVYVGAAALAVLWVSNDPHGAQRLRTLLSGDILWVTWGSMWPLGLASAMLAIGLRLKPRLLEPDRLFYPIFALVISLSVSILGLYLVFVVLIAPALGALPFRRRGHRRARLVAHASGVTGFVVGLGVSFFLDWPSGPTVVLFLLLVAALTHCASAGRLEG